MEKFLAKIQISLREGILDVQGKTVENALHSMEFPMVNHIRIGKFVTLHIEAENSDAALSLVDSACAKLIANPIIEDYKISIEKL